MRGSKVLAKQMMEDLGIEKLADKKVVAGHLRWLGDENEGYANSIFEVGVEAIVKDCKKLSRKEDKTKVEKYSNGDHSETLKSIQEAIGIITGVMRAAQYSEREVQRFVYEFYEQFNVPEDRRFLLKHVGIVTSCNKDRCIIEGDDENLYDAYTVDVRGGRSLQKGEVVSFIPDDITAKYIENAQHCDQDEADAEPLKYSPASLDDFWKLKDMVLYLAAPASPAGVGKGMVFIYKETPEGGKKRNYFIRHDGVAYLSDWY